MKRSIHVRFVISFFLLFALLSPTAVFAFGDGKKHFNQGMKHEAAEEWDKAVEEFALAVSDNPKNPEYRLHLMRSLFNASQMYIKKGSIAAKENNYEDGYMAFKRAYAFDPTNELARSEMERMVRLQRELNEATPGDKKNETGRLQLIPTSYSDKKAAALPPVSQKLEQLRDLPFPSGVDLQFIIKELTRELDLNVLFDQASFRTPGRKTYIELKNVTAARALDYIFLQEGLFFQKVGPRTILIADQATRRQNFQQLVLRTFYLANAAPKDVAKVVQTAIPAQPGRSQTIVLTDDATNSITVRDTQENIALIGKLIASLDKDRAEVVMEVAIYEVNKTDLMQFGNQIGTQNQLTNFGGSQSGAVQFGNNPLTTVAGAVTSIVSGAIPTGILLPTSNLVAFQSKSNTRLVASTQIHAFNNEDSSARIGQRVPVQSAQIQNGLNNTQNNNSNLFSTVINYEQIGLTLKFKPLVFPNQDVQVAMEIESKDIAGAQTLQPTFTERTIKGTARIQNNKTLLLASVAQGVESKGKQGLPLLGLIPIIGRLFTAPTRDNRQVDIVIAVTPRVIRAPAILPEDEIERPTGSLAVPTNNSLEAMVIQEDMDEQLALARRIPNSTETQLPDQQPVYVRTATGKADTTPAANQTTAAVAPSTSAPASSMPVLKPIDSSVKTLQLIQTADTPKTTDEAFVEPVSSEPPAAKSETSTAPSVQLSFGSAMPEMKAGEKVKIPVILQGGAAFRSGLIGIEFDAKRLAVRSVSFGDVFGSSLVNTATTPFLNQNGKMFVSLSAKDDAGAKADGTLAYIEIEALVDGKPEMTFDRDVLNFLTTDGKNFQVTF